MAFDGATARNDPATKSVAIVKHASNPLSEIIRQLRVGTGGTLKYKLRDDEDYFTITVLDGEKLDWEFKAIHTDSTATDLMGVV